jgi:phosphoribosylformylglycinamidine cyclo-ligase
LARRIAFEHLGLTVDAHVAALGQTVGDALLATHRSYLPLVRPLLATGFVKGMAHITGGGITDNLPRVLPDGTMAIVDRRAWTVPPIFEWLQRSGGVPPDDMLRTFNMGIGLIIVVAREHVSATLDALAAHGERGARIIGEIAPGDSPSVRYRE